jgi:hypothetical protein
LEKFLLKGLECENSRKRFLDKKKLLPLDLELLRKIRAGLRKLGITKGSRLSVWAGCLVGFWGAFRLGELFAKGKRKFDKFSDLLWEDVTWLPGKEGLWFSIKSGKIPGPPGDSAELYKVVERKFCPVRALSRLEVFQKTSGIWERTFPIFRRSSGKNLTKEVFLKTVNDALTAEGCGGKTLSGKSFRSGLLSALETCPKDFQETHLKSLGRWKSSAYRFYTWKGPVGFRNVFQAVSEQLLKNFQLSQEAKSGSGRASGSLTATAKKTKTATSL